MTRALLGADSFELAQNIIRDEGCGVGDGCALNMTFLKEGAERVFYNIEIGPSKPDINRTQMDIMSVERGEYSVHCNM